MTYTPQTWTDGSLSTPISAARLTVMENGIAGASVSLGGWNTGHYYTSETSTITTVAMTQSLLYLVPLLVPQSQSVDRLSLEVTTLAAATTIRTGIYVDVSGRPSGAPLVDTGTTLDASTTGNKEATISVSLGSGLYWLGAVAQGGSPTVRAFTGPGSYVGRDNLNLTVNFSAYTVASVTGALPNPFTGTILGNSTAPRVAIRAV